MVGGKRRVITLTILTISTKRITLITLITLISLTTLMTVIGYVGEGLATQYGDNGDTNYEVLLIT
jgi:hypothetical protein